MAVITIKPIPLKINNQFLEADVPRKLLFQGWSFFTIEVPQERVHVYDSGFSYIDLRLSAKKNSFGFSRDSRVIRYKLMELSGSISDSLWSIKFYDEIENINKDWDTIIVENEFLKKNLSSTIILERRKKIPWVWKHNNNTGISSKFISVKFE
ncbi:hypothetical protein [Winogradskyella sp.]|uniref:hypothetical protein n=1 Tax=Winogradskyella sp. TaxID=1883156 RepID=UPI0026173B53|nr:hypothetical protein [Winogradskyella sp.]